MSNTLNEKCEIWFHDEKTLLHMAEVSFQIAKTLRVNPALVYLRHVFTEREPELKLRRKPSDFPLKVVFGAKAVKCFVLKLDHLSK